MRRYPAKLAAESASLRSLIGGHAPVGCEGFPLRGGSGVRGFVRRLTSYVILLAGRKTQLLAAVMPDCMSRPRDSKAQVQGTSARHSTLAREWSTSFSPTTVCFNSASGSRTRWHCDMPYAICPYAVRAVAKVACSAPGRGSASRLSAMTWPSAGHNYGST